jgi:chemotaxis protein histidine kinase CheA
MKGTIKVKSTLGKGTKFTFILPLESPFTTETVKLEEQKEQNELVSFCEGFS